jgi:hypothetical protein
LRIESTLTVAPDARPRFRRHQYFQGFSLSVFRDAYRV